MKIEVTYLLNFKFSSLIQVVTLDPLEQFASSGQFFDKKMFDKIYGRVDNMIVTDFKIS
jgi:hypothetical protein